MSPWGPGMLLHTPQCPGRPPTERQAPMSEGPRARPCFREKQIKAVDLFSLRTSCWYFLMICETPKASFSCPSCSTAVPSLNLLCPVSLLCPPQMIRSIDGKTRK